MAHAQYSTFRILFYTFLKCYRFFESYRRTFLRFIFLANLSFLFQDDFLDCFGNSAVTGKKGTDIQDGKCSWLAVVALQRASSTQRKIMEEHYGR